jgi:hypothetical protein
METFRRLVQGFKPNYMSIQIVGPALPSWMGTAIPFVQGTGQSNYSWDIQFNAPTTETTFIYANLHNLTSLRFVLSVIDAGRSFVLRPVVNSTGGQTPLRGWGVEWSQISQINVRTAPLRELHPFGFLLPFPRPTTKFIPHIDVRFLAFLANYTNVPLLEILPA